MEKQFLALFDLDGTLFDTHDANFYAYKQALSTYGIELDRSYFRNKCFRRNYRDFLPELLNDDRKIEDVSDASIDNISQLKKMAHTVDVDTLMLYFHLL